MDIPSIEHALFPLTTSFEEFGIPYHLTGSLAIHVYGKPGMGQGIEVVVDIKLSQVNALATRLERQYAIKEGQLRTAILQRRSCDLLHSDTLQRLTLVLPPYRAYSQVQQERAQLHTLAPGGRQFCLAAPEDVVLTLLERYKLSGQHHQRHWENILYILEVQASNLDLTHMRLWATALDMAQQLETALVVARFAHVE